MDASLKVTKDFVKEFNEIMAKFKHDAVLVGIPEAKTTRNDQTGETNAHIMAINEFGSPALNIPARPVFEIGIRKAQEAIAEQFKKAASSVLKDGFKAIDRYYNRAGMIAANSIKKVINSQEGIKPPSPTTLAIRKAQGFKGEKALIVTGQLRNSITYVIRGKS